MELGNKAYHFASKKSPAGLGEGGGGERAGDSSSQMSWMLYTTQPSSSRLQGWRESW